MRNFAGMKLPLGGVPPLLFMFFAIAAAFPATAAGQAPAPSQEQAPAAPAGDTGVNMDFKDADIKLLIKFMADLTGRNFIVDEKVKGKVTIISPKKVTVDEAMKAFESTLEVHGYSLLEAGGATKVIPAAEARMRGSFGPEPGEPGDRLETRLLPMSYVKAEDIVNTLRPLVPVTGFITAYKPTNTLIIVDYASNIKKISGIIRQLDVPGHEETITVAQLRHAGARELAERLNKIFGSDRKSSTLIAGRPAPPSKPGQPSGSGGSESAPEIIPEDRVNAIIIVATRHMTDRVLALIEQLDIPAPPGQGKINVYYLKNADAEEMAKVLNNLTQSAAKPTRPGAPPKPASAVQLESGVTVTPDKATNSLVITASKEDFETLSDVIEKLDIRQKQVFVEALIMEVTSDRKHEFGVEWRTTSNFTNSGVQGVGGTNFGNINSVAENPLNAPSGLTIGVVDGVISFGGKEFLNLGGLLHALQSESGINILSTPNIMTTDNQEAEIVVAQNVPFVTGESQTTGGNTITTIERKNIGITLKITPQISESEVVKLDVYQEISSISPTQLDKAKDLITFTRSLSTAVVVRDGQNIVIGGLIRDDFTDAENKVPLFGDIPILGWLFKSRSKQKNKTNLLVFLTPHIINNDFDAMEITERQNEKLGMIDPELGGDFGPSVKSGKDDGKL